MTPEEFDNLQPGDIFHQTTYEKLWLVIDRLVMDDTSMVWYLLYYENSKRNTYWNCAGFRANTQALRKIDTLPQHVMPKYIVQNNHAERHKFYDTAAADKILRDLAKRIRAYQFCSEL